MTHLSLVRRALDANAASYDRPALDAGALLDERHRRGRWWLATHLDVDRSRIVMERPRLTGDALIVRNGDHYSQAGAGAELMVLAYRIEADLIVAQVQLQGPWQWAYLIQGEYGRCGWVQWGWAAPCSDAGHLISTPLPGPAEACGWAPSPLAALGGAIDLVQPGGALGELCPDGARWLFPSDWEPELPD
jgi:hypothetical protein